MVATVGTALGAIGGGSALAGAATVIGTAYSISQSEKAARAGREAAAVQKRQMQLRERRSRRQALRERQIRAAEVQVAGLATGAAGGSAVAGGLTGLGSQLGSGLGYASAQTGLSGIISDLGVVQQTALTRAQTGSAIAGLGMQGLSLTGLPKFPTTSTTR